MDKKKISIVLGFTCILVTFLMITQIKTMNSIVGVSDIGIVEDGLRDELLRWQQNYKEIYEDLEKAEKELEEQRKIATKNNDTSVKEEEELKLNNTMIGLTDVSGKGIMITLNDNSSVTSESISKEDNINKYLVHSEDLLIVINELKNAGAEAISINDQRIIPITSIICAGNVAEINGVKVGSPFIIKAIGIQEMLYGALTRPGGYIETLNLTGVVAEVKRSNNIEVAKYNGVLNYKYTKSVI